MCQGRKHEKVQRVNIPLHSLLMPILMPIASVQVPRLGFLELGQHVVQARGLDLLVAVEEMNVDSEGDVGSGVAEALSNQADVDASAFTAL